MMPPSPRPGSGLQRYHRRTTEELHRDESVASGRLRALRRVLGEWGPDPVPRFPHVHEMLRAERERLEAELADLTAEQALRPEERRS